MVLCLLTIFIGIALLVGGVGGSLRVVSPHGIAISGSVGTVAVALGIFGVGC